MLNNVDFGKMVSIKLNVNFDLDPLANCSRSLLSGDLSLWIDLYKKDHHLNQLRTATFPNTIEVITEYNNYILTWQGFQTEVWLDNKDTHNLSYEILANIWESTPVNVVRVTPSKENWYKEIFGVKFFVSYLEYKKDMDQE